MLQIQVEGKSLGELNQLAGHLKKEDIVEFASQSTPLFISNLAGEHEQNEEEKVADVNPDGDNWWAEAINAYPAWDYMDVNKDKFTQVNVAVLEIGKLGESADKANDESIKKDNVSVTPFSSKEAEYYTIGGSNISHAELVTKIIAADENPQTIRGVAEPIVDIKFTSLGQLSPDEMVEEANANSPKSISDMEVIYQIKNSIEDEAAKVINNSWGNTLMSSAGWKEDNWFKTLLKNDAAKDEGYEDYVTTVNNTNNEISKLLIIALDKLLQTEKNDFLIVQAAGNGYIRAEGESAALDAKYTGYFANINEDTYAEVADQVDVGLDEILNHIIIAGGAEPKGDRKSYQSPAWTGYGDAIDIAAPASYLFNDGTFKKEECGSPSKDKGDLGPVCGTSYAAPMVSGAAALVWAYQPELTASEVKSLLLDNAVHMVEDHRGDKTYSYPLLNMTAFLNEAPHNMSIAKMYMDEYPYYNELIETYRTAIIEQWDAEKLIEKDLGPLYDHPASTLSENYGYEFRDINGDGLPELILGIYREDGSTEINEIYALQNKKPVKVFVNGIRTNVSVYRDGTISETYGIKIMGYYELNHAGEAELKDGYEINQVGDYESLIGSKKPMTEEDIKALDKRYNDIGIIDHLFTPFVLGEEVAPKSEQHEEEVGLGDDEAKEIMKENYQKLEEVLLEDSIDSLYDKYHAIEEAQSIWESGVDPNSLFYNELYELLYPKVKDLVSEEGMESFINEKYSLYWQPPATISFFGPSPDLEILQKDGKVFKIKQTKEVGPQDIDGESYDITYIVKYVKQDGKWKFAGAEKQE